MNIDVERTITALDATLRAWEADDSPWIDKLGRTHAVFSPEVLRAGIRRGVAPWTADAMRSLHSQQFEGGYLAPERVAVWLAGSIPTASFLALTLPLLAGARVFAKPASADPWSADWFAESLRESDAGVGARLVIGDDPGVLKQADAVISYGSDESVAAVRKLAGDASTFVGYGHKVSLAWIDADADLAAAARELAVDLALWDGRGCLSPGWALVQDDGAGDRLRAFADELERAMARIEWEFPRGSLLGEEELAVREFRARVAARGEAELRMPPDSTAWTIALQPADTECPPGSLRTIPLVPVADLDAAVRWCKPLEAWLSTVGHAHEDSARVETAMARVGVSRICPLGRMQLPPLDWNHDGMEPMRPFLRSST